jgi:hypothetical protein
MPLCIGRQTHRVTKTTFAEGDRTTPEMRDSITEEHPMNPKESFCCLADAGEMHMAERELSAFMNAVTKLFGPAQARLSVEDWLDESVLMDRPLRSTGRGWRAVTIAASARLANRLTVERRQRTALTRATGTNGLPVSPFNRFTSALLG